MGQVGRGLDEVSVFIDLYAQRYGLPLHAGCCGGTERWEGCPEELSLAAAASRSFFHYQAREAVVACLGRYKAVAQVVEIGVMMAARLGWGPDRAGLSWEVVMRRTRVFLAMVVGLVMATGDGAAQQEGRFTTESFRNGQAVPVAKPKIVQAEGQPPTIVYAASRTSTGWLEVPGSGRVAIDGGVEWQGRVAYLSLTFNVVVQDAATKKVLWAKSVGALWDTITFENTAAPGQKPAWSLLLKFPGAMGDLGGGPGQLKGVPVKPRHSWSGSEGVR